VVRDPQGAAFAMWQAKECSGIGVTDEPSAFCWPELNRFEALVPEGDPLS
jgi:hypothetical protein